MRIQSLRVHIGRTRAGKSFYIQINAFVADYLPTSNTKIDENTQFGMDNGVMFLVIHKEQKAHGIYQWRFTQASGGLSIQKNAGLATANAISGFLKAKGLPFDLSCLVGDPLRDF